MKITVYNGDQIVRTFEPSSQGPRQSDSRPKGVRSYSTPIPLTFDAAPAEPDPVEMNHLASFPIKDGQKYKMEDGERGVTVYRDDGRDQGPVAIFPNGAIGEYESTADKVGFHVWRRKARATGDIRPATVDTRPVGPAPKGRPPRTVAEMNEYNRKRYAR